MESEKANLEREEIVSFLSSISLFSHFDSQTLHDLAQSLTLVPVEGGMTIISEGARDTNFYILYQGRLRVSKFEKGTKKENIIAEIAPGQFVGEIALLTHLPRTSTVRAVRDSILLKWDEKAFQAFEEKHAPQVIEIAKTALTRLAMQPRPTQLGENDITITIIPAGQSDHRLFAQQLAKKLQKLKPTLLVTPELCDEHFGRPIAQTHTHSEDHVPLMRWLQSLESQFGYIVYETDMQMTPWTQRCLRQADRLLQVADSTQSPELNSIETSIEGSPYTELILIHPSHQQIIKGTDKWLENRKCQGYHHVRLDYKPDLDKFIRFLTGRAFGIVLNGGGARGFAHAGALKAIEELNIPIDFVGGSSMGGIVAGTYASLGLDEMLRCGLEYSKHFKSEWTLPIVSLLKGKYNTDYFQQIWGDTKIEDLWTRFFCISTNLTEGTAYIHDRGLLWLALRTTSSIPAMYPPIYDEEGNILVDAGIINNMPVDVMRKMICGGKILAINCNKISQIGGNKLASYWISGWNLFFQRLNPFTKETKKYNSILEVLLTAVNLSSFSTQKRMSQEADYLLEFNTSKYHLLEFRRAQEIMEIGYRYTLEQLPKLMKEKSCV